MACCSVLNFPVLPSKPNHRHPSSPPPSAAPPPRLLCLSSKSSPPFLSTLNHPQFSATSTLHRPGTLKPSQSRRNLSTQAPISKVVPSVSKGEPLKVMISGAPASGKGTQSELSTKKYDLVHIAAGDLRRAEIAAGTENGRQAKEYMDKGQLVPNEIVVMMVKDHLLQSDSQEKGWLLDGYPRSFSQATALENFGFKPDLFILLEVLEENLIERVVGRRLDPVTGRIYHLKYSPPETEEIAARLTQCFDDTEEKVDGSVSKEDVFAQIDSALAKLLEQKNATLGSVAA